MAQSASTKIIAVWVNNDPMVSISGAVVRRCQMLRFGCFLRLLDRYVLVRNKTQGWGLSWGTGFNGVVPITYMGCP